MNKKNPNIKILVACHKADPSIRQDDIYTPIHVGKALHPDVDLDFPGDNTGDNISEKNESYCELTALYWAWKNLPEDVDIVGLAHYRRYFKFKKDARREIIKYLNKYDAIAITPFHLMYSNSYNLAQILTWEDMALMIKIILEVLPDSKKQIIKYFYNDNKYSIFNMLIMKKSIFEKYCTTLFTILYRLEEYIKPYPWFRLNRNIGYIGEALMGFIFLYYNYNIKYVDVINLSDNNKHSDFRMKISRGHKNLIFNLSQIKKNKEIFIFPAAKSNLINEGINLNF